MSGRDASRRPRWNPTPLVQISLPGVPSAVHISAKVEAANPTASVKDRTARWMVDAAEDSGVWVPETASCLVRRHFGTRG